ncbi:Ran GTPase-binding protein MOG1 [Saccharomyces paradoxus]|uniref:Ran GTPase-binding protein MOG1 n=1 Tax=Saccharomyces paradoxus TaxID=27291 RepID=A0A8B8UUA1_SACPA|nr:Mog1 [Saccharomyces paradoxus]QHS74303.1 Mog1 [Saccharomyces paradoxus]
MNNKEVELYGGAITTVVPPGFMDASSLREVPDTQEVYVNSRRDAEEFGDGLATNESIIVDLLETVDKADLKKAWEFHVEDLTELNGTTKWEALQEDIIQQGTKLTGLVMEVANKWGKPDLAQTVVIGVALIRLPQFDTDAVISINVPLTREEASKASNKVLPLRCHAVYQLLQEMVQKFHVVDTSLFA